MLAGSMLEKLKKAKKSRRRESANAKEPSTETVGRQGNEEENVPPKSNLRRVLESAANRTFLISSPRVAAQQKMSEDDSPMAIQEVALEALNSLDISDEEGAERAFDTGGLTGTDVGGFSSAGWHLTVDTSGSGVPLRTRKMNQDAYGVHAPFRGGLLFGVYDGHGAHGRAASQLVRDVVPSILGDSLKNMANKVEIGGDERRKAYARCFTKAFCEAEKAMKEACHSIDHAFSGTTGTCIWVDGEELWVAWSGDSRCIMSRDGATVDLTWDQKPARADEKKRVRASGGRVTRWKKGAGPQRVWLPDEWLPGLAMTRSIGDTILSKYGVVASPEMTVTRVEGGDFVVAASDGVWEFMSSEEVVAFVERLRENGVKAEQAARELVGEAVKRWGERECVVDDTTAVVVYLDGRKKGKEARPMVVAGNGRLSHFEPHNDVEDDE